MFRKDGDVFKLTNFGNDTGDDQLLLASGLDGSTEVGVVPGVDLTLATDEGGIGVQVHDLLEHEAVRTLVGRAGQHSGEVEDVAQSSVADDVVTEVVGVVITNDLRETDLVVNDEESLDMSDAKSHSERGATYSIVLVESVPSLGGDGGCEKQRGLDTSREVHDDRRGLLKEAERKAGCVWIWMFWYRESRMLLYLEAR